eukprot:scaffold53708_cov50-Phaeocystis_antarctica.AAC.3
MPRYRSCTCSCEARRTRAAQRGRGRPSSGCVGEGAPLRGGRAACDPRGRAPAGATVTAAATSQPAARPPSA